MASLPRASTDLAEQPAAAGIVTRARRASLSVLNSSPQLGIWQAAGTAIAQAPNITELRDMDNGAANITFNSQGHSARLAAVYEDTGRLGLVRSDTWKSMTEKSSRDNQDEKRASPVLVDETTSSTTAEDPSTSRPNQSRDAQDEQGHPKHHLWHHSHGPEQGKKAPIGPTIKHGLLAFWKFFITPAGFLITIYCLNIVAWGAMLFFLLLKAAPAMNHPSADDNSSPRKIWLEISSQILNALFCVTGFGLAPWRFRDLYLYLYGARLHNRAAMTKLVNQNKGWFRPPPWYTDSEEGQAPVTADGKAATFTGRRAPPTPVWKLGFTIWMMVLNTLLQAVLCFFMWHYNRIDRPGWATGTFIGLGCGVAMMAGAMSWWEGRKVKKIEGPAVEVVNPKESV